MNNLTDLFVQLAALITACTTIVITIKKLLINPINRKIDGLEKETIKTDLVNFINDIEGGVTKSEIQKLNAHELYTCYSKLGGNSYIHEHWESLTKEGKI